MQKRHTASYIKEMVVDFSAMAGDTGYDLANFDINTVVDAIYYLASHNPGDERMSLHDFASLAAELSTDSTLLAQLGSPMDIDKEASQYLDVLVALTDTSLIDKKLTPDEIADIVGVDKEMV
jgi:hypothetical protein